jgi:hypothetical protein
MADLEAIVAAIRDQIDYERAYGAHVRLIGRGDERMAFCVFHENTDTPALSINVEEGVYHCKNPECSAQGDLFTFLQRVRSQTFRDVVHELARDCGLSHLLMEESPPATSSPIVPSSNEGIQQHGSDGFDTYVAPQNGVSLSQLKSLTQLASAQSSTNGAAPLARTTPKKEKKKAGDVPPIPMSVVEKYHATLMKTPSRLLYLQERRGLTLETIERFKLGFDGSTRYMIPVIDEEGLVRNIRKYFPEAKDVKFKMLSWREGYGTARLFPMAEYTDAQEPMFIFEGEMDCMLARQNGLNAYSATGGAGTWRDTWNDCFVGRRVVICYDNDAPGATGARKVATSIRDVVSDLRVVKIPLAEPKGADFTDYIVGHGMTIEDFLELVAQAPVWYQDGVDEPTGLLDPTEVHLSEASEAQYYNVPLKFATMVSGKTTAPFLVPSEVKVGCPTDIRGTLTICTRCAVNLNNGPVTKKFGTDDNDILRMVNVPDGALSRTVKTLAGVPAKCPVAYHDVLAAQNVESVQLIPDVVFSEKDTPYVTRMAYYLGHGLTPNRSYIMQAVTVPEPQKQLATHLIHTATPAQSNIDAFSLSEDVVTRLRAFQPYESGVDGLWDHLKTIYADLEKVTGIYERHDLMLAVDLVYHSALTFRFQGNALDRGWTEALIIGDSRTGKSTIVKSMMNHYRAGEMTSAENTSSAGLIGGLQQIGTSWILQWGRVPLNDRRLLAVDEISGMTTEAIGRMSSMRSSGIAEIIKVHTERTSARTRMVWIGNPRWDRAMASFSQGVLAVKELIGAPADIARFDMIVTAATDDVALSTVNAKREPEAPELFTSELCHQRVMWAWSRASDQITWAEDAEAEVLRIATEHGHRYRHATEVPIVEPNEQRIKIARLAVATAITFFSASDDGQVVIVKTEHVRFAAQFLEQLYRKPSLAFEDYATQQRRLYQITQPDKVQKILNRNPMAPQMLMEQTMVTQKDLQEILLYDDLKETREAITTLRESSFLKRQGTSGYLKTPAAILMLRRLIAEKAPSPLLPFPIGPSTTGDDEPTW